MNHRPAAPEQETRTARARRAPRYSVFMCVGAAFGLTVVSIITLLYPADPSVGMAATVAYMGLYGVAGGVALGGAVALVVDARSRRHAKVVTVERGAVSAADQPDDPA